MWSVAAPLSTQSSSISGGRPGEDLRCRAAYAVIRELPGDGERRQAARVTSACPGEARRTVYQVRASGADISIVGSKTMISSSALLLRFDGRYHHDPGGAVVQR